MVSTGGLCTDNIMEEIWRDILGYEGVYQVSNKGRVKRLVTEITMRNQVCSWIHKSPELIFRPNKDSRGYYQVVLGIGKKRTARVHRLVAEAFLKPPSDNLVKECLKVGSRVVWVNHKDGDCTNNRVENLEWCTPSYNLRDAFQRGAKKASKGVDHINSKLTEEDVLKIYELSSKRALSQERIANMFGIKQITVSNIKTGRSWSWLTGADFTGSSRITMGSDSISESDVH